MQGKSDLASASIEKMLAELRSGYIAELPTRLEEIEDIILGLKNSASFTEDYQSIYRHVHSIKGSAGTHGLHIISTVCHALEDKVIEVEGHQSLASDAFIDSLLKYIDLLRKTLELVQDGVDDFADIEAELERLSGKGSEYEYNGLVIAASDLHRKLVAKAFEKHPVKFRYINNGYEALGMLLKQTFDFFITDMEVPDLQGMPIISAVRLSSSRNKMIPSILLTSRQVPSYNKGIDPDYVIKKDSVMLENLSTAAKDVINQLQT